MIRVFRYFRDKYLLNEKKYISKYNLEKAKEKFLNIYKENECIPRSEFESYINMIKFIDFLIDEVK